MKCLEDGTFGSFAEYGTLNFICEKMSAMNEREVSYLSSFIHNFNTHVNNINDIKDKHTRRFVLQCVRDEYHDRVMVLVSSGYDPYFVSHLMNYVVTRIKISMEKASD